MFPTPDGPRAHTVITSPLGPLTLVATGAGLVGVYWDTPKHRPPAEALGEAVVLPGDGSPETDGRDLHREGAGPATGILRTAQAQLHEYFTGGRTSFALPLDPPDPLGTSDPPGSAGAPPPDGPPSPSWRSRVRSALLDVPYGTTTTYGRIAEQLGAPRAARAVGTACGRNPLCVVVPCHRVVGANGALTGYVGGLDRKKHLLDLERRIREPGA
ncbi:MAG: methylated-DNA-[protein]-cysteine S-methyltransferase [Actinomycetota bacterium]|nr:methylated-DNA-[protein]-cysteine S-methyltransferase [Actinomycetota bacterium]